MMSRTSISTSSQARLRSMKPSSSGPNSTWNSSRACLAPMYCRCPHRGRPEGAGPGRAGGPGRRKRRCRTSRPGGRSAGGPFPADAGWPDSPPSVIEIYMGPALYHITAGAHYGGGVGEAVLKSLQVRLADGAIDDAVHTRLGQLPELRRLVIDAALPGDEDHGVMHLLDIFRRHICWGEIT